MWVIQELVSARQANFYCGKTCLQWPALALAIWLFSLGLSSDQRVGAWEILCDNHNIPLKRAWGLVLLRRAFHAAYPKSIGYLMELAQLGAYRDPRDKVYAVFGLAEDEVRKNLQHDYSKSVSWAYVMVVKAPYLRYKDVTILNLAEWTTNRVCPSWSPDLTRERRIQSFDPGKKLYLVSGKLDTSAAFSKDLQSLHINVLCVDVVQESKARQTKEMFSGVNEREDWSSIVNKMVRQLKISG